MKDLSNKIDLQIDISIPYENNILAKVFYNLIKYKGFQIEIENVWDLKTLINTSNAWSTRND